MRGMSVRGTAVAWPMAGQTGRRPLALWNAASLEAATGGTANTAFQVSGVEIDSRDVQAGDLFFALQGENTDGHCFLEKAFENGAAAAVVDRPVPYPHLLVEDTTAALNAV